MVVAFSPHREAGGTLHFPSPTPIHHVDSNSALAQLRRSLSRSPSKGPTFRLVTSKSTSPSPGSPLSPSPLSPQRRAGSASLLSNSSVISPSPLATPFPPSARRSRSSARKFSPPRSISRVASSQRSPAKRCLSDSTDNGNANQPTSSSSGTGDENLTPLGSPEDKIEAQKTSTDAGISEDLLSPYHALTKRDKVSGYLASCTGKSSPLKRSDGIMNFDLASLESPSAKRRSLHGASFGPDFDIFDHEAALQPHPQQYIPSADHAPFSDAQTSYEHTNFLSKRTSSLRKTTLQQRYEKPILGRLKSNTDLTRGPTTSVQTGSKSRPRISLDYVFPQVARESPFSSQAGLPSASVHPISHKRNEPQSTGSQPIIQRHPLSRTITQSSSSSSLAEDSPTHIPPRYPESKRPTLEFTKSLPIGIARPIAREPVPCESSERTSSSETSFATPENYKLARPLPAAFMSTGLISKRNKDMDPEHLDLHASVTSMPDTPCKRPVSLASVASITAPDSAANKSRQGHQSLHSFGTPSTPFNPHHSRPSLGSFPKGVSIFGSSFGSNSLNRRGSFLGVDGEENSASSGNFNSQSSNDVEAPPTPTKQPFSSAPGEIVWESNGPTVYRPHTSRNAEVTEPSDLESPRPKQCCKSTPTHSPGGSAEGDNDSIMEGSPSTTLRFRSLNAISSFSNRPHLLRHSRSPTPLSRFSHSVPSIRIRKINTKPSPLSPASPLFSAAKQRSPRTPQSSVLPPDPSGLSISARGDGNIIQNVDEIGHGNSFPLPATPTTSRDQISRFGKSRASMTPLHNPAPAEFDTSLLSRFSKVEIIGTGEFSQVFRVTKSPELKPSQNYFNLPATQNSPRTPLLELVWAVKKTRQAFIGPRDRKRKLQEVQVLKTLGRSDHTVELVDSWENKDHLYIQTEYCEEGSMDLFLDQVGRKARLDDFRIWKIMLELSLGLKHIHDSGIIHLDLKPANVLITFEGVLKIGDFGMATSWPAPPGIEGEGDREYIGPEILMGQYDKPADIFALGLIMLEIAGNVMLPDNGASWQRLRSGDMSDVPSLTSSSEASNVLRDSFGKPLSREESFEDICDLAHGPEGLGSPPIPSGLANTHITGQPKFQLLRCGELSTPPDFMIDPHHEQALDKIVRWMISPQPSNRPVVRQILATAGVRWADSRRRSGATIYEGNWGPADEVLQDDAVMIDV
ncbi:hypothetical protein MMC17_010090 [Xylographa soralifera]|nr:hypothetical protein [Xylographa soralifera]